MDISSRINPSDEPDFNPEKSNQEFQKEQLGPDSLINPQEAEEAVASSEIPKTSIKQAKSEAQVAAEKFIGEMKERVGIAFQFVENSTSPKKNKTRKEKIIPKLPESLKNKSILAAPPILIPSVLTYQITETLKGLFVDRRKDV